MFFGKNVHDILFINNKLVIYFEDGNRLTIDMKESTFADPMAFMKWLETRGTESVLDVVEKVAA